MFSGPGTAFDPPQSGMLLVGHGTRDRQGLAEFLEVARQVRALAREYLVEPCFLELAAPDIAAATGRLLERGIRRLTVAPLLLLEGGHAKQDIPAEVRAATRMAGGLEVKQTPPLECHEAIMELSVQRFREALAGRPPCDPDRTLLLLVARGSSDESALAGMQRFAAVRGPQTPVGRVEICFAAAASPGLEATLRRAAETEYRRVVVQPHLLFAGEVLSQINAAVAEMAARPGEREGCEREWIVTPHLGPSPLVAEALVDLARRAWVSAGAELRGDGVTR